LLFFILSSPSSSSPLHLSSLFHALPHHHPHSYPHPYSLLLSHSHPLTFFPILTLSPSFSPSLSLLSLIFSLLSLSLTLPPLSLSLSLLSLLSSPSLSPTSPSSSLISHPHSLFSPSSFFPFLSPLSFFSP